MFNRSKRKIILSIMVSLVLLLAVTMSVIMLASYREVLRRDSEMLRRYAELYSLEQGGTESNPGNGNKAGTGDNAGAEERSGSGDKTGAMHGDSDDSGAGPHQKDHPPDERADYQLATFYSVALAEDGTVLAVNSGVRGLYEEEELIEIARDLLSQERPEGRIGSLSYLVSSKDGYTLVAFIDNTVTTGSMKMLLRNVLVFGGASIIAMFFISLYLAKRIIRPLEENDKQQKQFISDASHELKTPVAVISANAEMLFREVGENEWLANIRYENERMGDLVKQLLDLSRAENSEVPMETVDFSRVVTGEVLALESIAFESGKTIRSDITDEINVSGSQTQLTQLVSVLLDNAIRHGTGSEIDVSLEQQGHTAVLSVTNEGDEIPPEKQEHLFDRFYRIDEARSSEGHHYGLGLSIAKAVTEKHGGSISVSCKDGKVSFTAVLPTGKIQKA